MEISERKFPTNRQGSGLKPVHFPTLAEIMPDVRNMTSTLQFKMRIAAYSTFKEIAIPWRQEPVMALL
jgi:hypothetical protein